MSRLSQQAMTDYEELTMQIFVGNLPFTTTEEDLALLFHPYGAIARVQIITNHVTGRSRGFGFVDMPDVTEAQAAIAGLQGATLGERALTIAEAHAREEQDGRRRTRG